MRINQGYLLVLLLASLSASYTSDCPTPELHGQPPYDKCAKLYSVLEAALLQNPTNLYQLHDSFFPSSSSEPIYARVTYKLKGGCDDHGGCYHTCWTSSVLLRSVNPVVPSGLQPQLLNILLGTVRVSNLTVNYSHGAQLSLELNVTAFNFSDHTTMCAVLCAVLQELTQWLKVYGSTQQSRSSWTATDFKYKGYRCESTYNLVTTAVLISISVLTVALTTIALIKVAPKLYQKLASHIKSGNQSYKVYSFFWASSFVASVCNIAVLLFESISFIFIFSPSYWIIKVPMIIKVSMMFFLILLDILVAICIPKNAEFPIPYLAYILSFPLCCTCCCCSKQLRSKWIQTLALTSLLIFAQFIALSALPAILWTFIVPDQTLSVTTLFAAAIFCVIALIALLLRNIGQLARSRRCRDNCSVLQPFLILMVTLFLAIMILSFYIYIKFISGVTTNQVEGYIVSFLPSAILTIIGWFVTKDKFFKQTFSQENDSTRNRSQPDFSTELTTPLTASVNV